MHPDPVPLAGVTPREREVFDLLGEHLTHAQIAERLVLSVRTVESHVAALRRKLEVPGHRDLVRLAVDRHVVRSAAGSPPAPLTALVGRDDELARLDAALHRSRLVTVVGPGGVGKTRLALALAHRHRSRWLDLVPVPDAAGLADALARVCGAEPTSNTGPVQAAIGVLRNGESLLVLDNAEHLVQPVAVLVEQLLTACGGLRVLVTSRVRLAVPHEQVHPVAGLGVEPNGDAVRLFVERAVAAGATPFPAADRDRIAAVCAALGGLPLAIELAAVRAPALGLDGIERGLLDQPSLLAGGARASGRHRSLHELLDWSSALLGPAAATCLPRLSVVIAPFDVGAATAVAAFGEVAPADVPAALTELAEHHLVVRDRTGAAPTYQLLEPVRQYAATRLGAADADAVARHLAWCATSVASLLDSDPDRSVPAGLDPVAADVRAALARPGDAHSHAGLARAFGLLLFRHGSLREAQERFEQAGRLEPDPAVAADDLRRGAAVAKCRVDGPEALRLELASASRADDAGAARSAALAMGRVVELLNRFPGMFAADPALDDAVPDPGELAASARRLAADDPHVAAQLAVAEVGYAGPYGLPTTDAASAAYELALVAGDPVLQSAALDAATAARYADDIEAAHRIAQQRLNLVLDWSADPAIGLELKDALHVASYTALGAGRLDAARDAAGRQQRLPFLRERRDLADDEAAAPAALAGDTATVREVAARFLADWDAAGRPVAPGRGLLPSAVALAYGLAGDSARRTEWLSVLAELRGVPVEEATAGTGHGELFDALVLLHEDRPDAAFDRLTGATRPGLFTLVFRQWIVAVTAEAAVLSGRPDAPALVDAARQAAAANPVAGALARRAAALLAGDGDALPAVVEDLARCGARYQAERTRLLAARLRPSGTVRASG